MCMWMFLVWICLLVWVTLHCPHHILCHVIPFFCISICTHFPSVLKPIPFQSSYPGDLFTFTKYLSVVSQLVLFILMGSWGRGFFLCPCGTGCALPLLNIKYPALLDHSYEEGETNLHTIAWHLNCRFAPDFCLMTVWDSTVLFVRSMHYVPYVIHIVHLAGH
jgi:hypothetical protein